MATRRPRVPKTSQRQLAEVGSGAAQRTGTPGPGSTPHLVGGHSAKVIPLDAAPSRQSPEPVTSLAPREPVDPASADRRPAARVLNGSPASPDAEASDGSGPILDDAADPADTVAGPSPEPTPGQRRADERRNLLRRSVPRGHGRSSARTPAWTPDRAPGRSSGAATAPSSTRSPGASSTPAFSAATAVSTPGLALVPVEPVPARNLTGRSVAFLVVLFVAAVLLAPTLRVFLDQQAELRAVQEEIAAEQQLQQDLTSEIARWEDPAYIQQQARERFNLVMPGEQTYMVIGGDETVEDPVPPPASPSEVNQDMPWADALLDSVVRAGTD
ncbi:septum formation initiator family protein [Citricoccus alkalitolerans]|uniref:Septum formation initiator family protein n=1 Tax=Citricoccus alkalitolerans TaxID=246603 RepID=A0ABV8Y1Q6_9MICC